MKALLMIIVPLVIFLGFSIWFQNSLVDDSEVLSKHLRAFEKNVNAQSWDKAATELNHFKKEWHDIRRKWKVTIGHQEIDNIEESLARVEILTTLESKKDCLMEVAALKLYIQHIPEKESFKLSNIF